MASSVSITAEPARLGEAREFVESVANDHGFDDDALYQIKVASNEAVSNAIEHGKPCPDGTIEVRAEVEEEDLALYVRDCGEFVLADGPRDPIAERGRGFTFMTLLMDDVSLDTEPGHTVVRLAKRLPDVTSSAA
jgi:serine/threonine-protein kinase RsbW